MNVVSFNHFEKDVKKIVDKKLALSLKEIILKLQKSSSLFEIQHIKKMKSPGNYYRIRIGDYRLGIRFVNNSIQLLRFLHRKEIYRYFLQDH